MTKVHVVLYKKKADIITVVFRRNGDRYLCEIHGNSPMPQKGLFDIDCLRVVDKFLEDNNWDMIHRFNTFLDE